MSKKEDLKQQILELTRIYYAEVHGQKKDFVAGKTMEAVILMIMN